MSTSHRTTQPKMTMLRNDTSEECEYNIGKYKIYFLCR